MALKRLTSWTIAVVTAALLAGVPASTIAQSGKATSVAKFEIPKIPYERYTLPNGMTVILSQDRSVPIVAMTIWYHVGSKNEKPGRTGFAHLFEHMMFEGSQNAKKGTHFGTIEEVGGTLNATTDNDRTNYFEIVPSSQLETILWLESDRMGFLLPAMDEAKLNGQRAVVKNERRQRVDNQVFGTAGEAIASTMYPASNPYSWPVIGSMADLDAASIDDVKDFFRTYYAPNNATLALVGDFDAARAKNLINKYFGPIPKGTTTIVRPVVKPTRLTSERRLVLEDTRATLPRIFIVWPTVGDDHKDAAALGALGWMLSSDRTSPLSKVLVYDKQLATGVGASQRSYENAGEFSVGASPRPGASLTNIERTIDSVITNAQTTPFLVQQLERYKNYVRVRAIMGIDQNISKAEVLASGQVYKKDPLYYITETQNELALTPADIQRVAKNYLTSGRVVLSMIPAGKTDLASKPDLPFTNVTPKVEQ